MHAWKLHFNGSSSKVSGFGAKVVLESRARVKEVFHQDSSKKLTSNESECAVLITGLQIARSKKIQRFQVRGDSKLVCNQVTENWEVRSENL